MPDAIELTEADVTFTAVRAQGAGGQNVNKVSNAAHLRFDIGASALPDEVKQRLLQLGDARVSKDGVVVIKAQAQRSLERNRTDALARLNELVARASHVPKVRRPTKPSKRAKQRRLDGKTHRGRTKALRGKVEE